MSNFIGTALPLSNDGLNAVCDDLGVRAAEVWSVLSVETAGCGYLGQRSPRILFERHIFHSLTGGIFDRVRPDLSNAQPGGYLGGQYECDRLRIAMTLNDKSLDSDVEGDALMSASWGIGQIMGRNYRQAGFSNVREFVAAALASEDAQLKAFATFLHSTKLDAALRTHDWVGFARGYNGPRYSENSYDQRLASNYARFQIGPMPDLTVRTAQIMLLFLGYHAGGVDGFAGKFTISALNQFQESRGIKSTHVIDQGTISILTEALDSERV